MVDNCKHVRRMRVGKDHSILNPQKWMCGACGTTESVWACLSCPSVACGRYIEEHAVAHFTQTKHPLAIEVNDKYVFCYECDEYVLNDNAAGDLKLMRNALSAITTQNFSGMARRGKRLLRSQTFSLFGSDANKLIQADKCHTAIVHRRLSLMNSMFASWKESTQKRRPEVFVRKPPPPPRKTPPKPPPKPRPNTAPAHLGAPPRKKKRTIVPGVVGLRNLGNTCYMNAILQVLSSLDELRQYFENEEREKSEKEKNDKEKDENGPRHSKRLLQRQTTTECYERVNYEECSHQKGGLNGGGTTRRTKHNNNNNHKSEPPKSLSNELHALFRVMWSGKWAIVSPHSLLHAVWNVIPFFKGYSQQDAQEFMCEFLDKVENEIQNDCGPRRELMRIASNVVRDTFQGEIVSQVRCQSCENVSRTYEPFYDLSLEFPDRYQMTRVYRVVSEDSCHLTEMLGKFTEEEELEGKIYSCSKCNLRRRRASHKPMVLTHAKKQLLLSRLPKVLRLHLKRFRWSGRNHREKINVHVTFDQELDMTPFISVNGTSPVTSSAPSTSSRMTSSRGDVEALYQLSAVVIHHGRGFSSGHYTAYCWNDEATSWVHCNDARVESCQLPKVLQSQAYILLYTLKGEKIQLDQLTDLQQNLVDDVNAEIQFRDTISRNVDDNDDDPEVSFKSDDNRNCNNVDNRDDSIAMEIESESGSVETDVNGEVPVLEVAEVVEIRCDNSDDSSVCSVGSMPISVCSSANRSMEAEDILAPKLKRQRTSTL